MKEMKKENGPAYERFTESIRSEATKRLYTHGMKTF
jgi:hypothetical protein